MRSSPLVSSLFLAAALAACAPVRPPVTGGAVVTGVLWLPAEGRSAADCEAVSLSALAEGDPTPVGHATLHASAGRCLYTVSDVPPGVALTLVPALRESGCAPGTRPAFQPERVPLAMVARETRTVDFHLSCAVATR